MKTEVIHVRVSQSLKGRITAVSRKTGITVSDLIKQAIEPLIFEPVSQPEDESIVAKLNRELAGITFLKPQ